jgi:putative ABC transport system substrate-binding protein
VYGLAEHVGVGGLMAYAPSFLDHYRRAAAYVDKILRGANFGDLLLGDSAKWRSVMSRRNCLRGHVAWLSSLLGVLMLAAPART